ncbi:MAG: peroxiredoxin (alkyl hydroperoxide reductase subunit C) [Oleispira sp.]|jgi:peroxiredoxin (alkyl hydroperoxide reductase subunit C)
MSVLDHRLDTITKLGVEVMVFLLINFTHNVWRNTPINQGGIGAVRYTLAADINQKHTTLKPKKLFIHRPSMIFH